MGDEKKDRIIELINELFGDRSLSLNEALRLQSEIRDAAGMNCDALTEDGAEYS